MRIFIAVTLPIEIRSKLLLLQQKLQQLPVYCKWVEKENFHLTLSFLGECSSARVAEVRTLLEKKLAMPSVDIQLGNILLLPDNKHAQVIVVDILKGKSQVEMLSHTITKLVGGRFSLPHITLARIKQSPMTSASVLEQICFTEYPVGVCRVSAVSVVKSVLTPNGPKYNVLHEITLK